MTEDWTEKYRPDTIGDLVGNQKQIKKIVNYIQNFNKEDDPLLLYGPPGLGKTSVVNAIIKDLGLASYNIDASDKRTKGTIGEELNEVSKAGGFLGEMRVVVVDEVDNLDRGGSQAVNQAIKSATQPIIMMCNDYWDGVPKSLRNKCDDIEFESINEGPMVQRLMYICDQEGIDYEVDALRKIAQDADGDMRAAINNLQATGTGQSKIKRMYLPEYDYPRRVVLIGDFDIDPRKTRKILDDFGYMIELYDEVMIRGTKGFDIVAGEWANRLGIEVSIHPPFYEEEMFDDKVWQMRYETLSESGNHYDPVFYKEEPDWGELADEFNFYQSVEMAYGWVSEDSDEMTKELWDRLDCEKANLVNLATV